MGGRINTCSLDILDHSSSVNWENTFFNDLWVRDCVPSRDWVFDTKDKLVHFKQE